MASGASTTTVTASAAAAAAAEEKPPRKFPPPCWTHDETLALIEAYRERWYALRRGYLRTADWDAVAAAVTERCPDAAPAKTSAQCRHKMEKLRQRYRAEKQRSLGFPPGRFFSSWFFFDNMDAMENGTNVATPVGLNNDQTLNGRENSDDGVRVKSLFDHNILKLKFSAKNSAKLGTDSGPNYGFVDSTDMDFNGKNHGNINGYSPYYGKVEAEDGEGDGMDFVGGVEGKRRVDGSMVPPGFKAKKFENMKNVYDFGGDGGNGGRGNFDNGSGFSMKSPMDQDLVPPRLRIKKLGKFDRSENIDGGNGSDGYWVKVGNERGSAMGSSMKGKFENVEFSDISRKKSGGTVVGGVKRGADAVGEMVTSIKMLGEGFVKMEKMKMDMAREMEKMRMEMEMKRNELILESQKQIVDAFVKGLLEVKKKKAKTTTGSHESC